MALYRHDLIVCPWCGGESGHRVDHLYGGRVPYGFGPWHCNACRKSFRGEVNAPGDVSVQKDEVDRTERTRQMVLLKFDGKDGPVYFVMDHDRYHSGEIESEAEHQDHERYFFEEHSCPTNWLRECVAVIEDGDCDPHGFLEFVRAVEVPESFDGDQDDMWPVLFPEAFDGDVIDGVSSPIEAAKMLALTPEPERS